jgi:hypothetical protein
VKGEYSTVVVKTIVYHFGGYKTGFQPAGFKDILNRRFQSAGVEDVLNRGFQPVVGDVLSR